MSEVVKTAGKALFSRLLLGWRLRLVCLSVSMVHIGMMNCSGLWAQDQFIWPTVV